MKTTDLWLATFIMQSGHELSNYSKVGHRKVEFEFDLSPKVWKDLKMGYITSTFSKFEQDMNKLRELCYE